MNGVKAGENVHEEIIRLKTTDLEQYKEDTPYDFVCMKCEGIVKIQRHMTPNAFPLRAEAYCFLCGQHFVFEDIDTYEEKLMKGMLPEPEDTRNRFDKIRERAHGNSDT